MPTWLATLLQTVLGPPALPLPTIPSLSDALAHYHHVLEALDAEPEAILVVLLARDQVEVALTQTHPVLPEAVQAVSVLDGQLQQELATLPLGTLATWRRVMHPSETAWWWFLDQQSIDRKVQGDSRWDLVTGALLVLAAPLVLEIIKPFWASAPDAFSIWVTLTTLIITASPFLKQGRAAMRWPLERVQFVKLKHRTEMMTAMTAMALVTLLVFRLWLLPGPLTTYYNNAGATARTAGNLSLAQQMFQRAAELNPGRVVPYHNLAEAYRDSGLEDKAKEWYQKAIDHDANFAPAYRGLGELYNHQGSYAQAERILSAGLGIIMGNVDEATQKVTRYELLANLGWSYWGQQKLILAQVALESAVKLEAELKLLGEVRGAEYRLALPHFYLAQVYEEAGNITQAKQQWEECLRFLDQADWRQQERYIVALQHLQNLEGK